MLAFLSQLVSPVSCDVNFFFVMVAAFLLLHPSRHPSRPGSKRAGTVALCFQQSPSRHFVSAHEQRLLYIKKSLV